MFKPVRLSLADITGPSYVQAVCRARAFLGTTPVADLERLATAPVDFWPESLQARLRELLPRVGQRVVAPLADSAPGASTEAFTAATHASMAPLSGLGWYRIGEDGRLYVISKSEHYHASLGHAFPGYALIERAQALGVPNATHNNTRGEITRLLETALLDAANAGRGAGKARLDRVLNLETGSLALEAALKLVLARFHQHDPAKAVPEGSGRMPVILVMADDDGGPTANYHGTTVLTQVCRGLWPQWRRGLEEAGLMRVRAVRPNDIADFARAVREENAGGHRVAAFFHEIILMNYGAKVLTPEYLQEAYAICAENDIATVVDEIQSCAWYAGGFLYTQYGIAPDMVAIGKGFPGGIYPASRLLFRSHYDILPQFGALVTNGQEELASLACLVTLAWLQANGAAVDAVGQALERGLGALPGRFPGLLEGLAGRGHLLGLRFRDLTPGRRFATLMNEAGYDLSVQSYKSRCPPVALCKLPIIADECLVEAFVTACAEALRQVS